MVTRISDSRQLRPVVRGLPFGFQRLSFEFSTVLSCRCTTQGGRPGLSRVLLIEPDEALRMLYAEELDEDGYDVVTCADCNQAIISIQHKRPDLVIVDISTGRRDQPQFLTQVKDTHQIPVILCSTDPAARAGPLTRLADGFVVKDSTLARLREAIRGLLADRNT